MSIHVSKNGTISFIFMAESEKVGLKLKGQKTKIMATSPTTSWQIDRETVETVRVFILEGSKITADHDCSHEIKRCSLKENLLQTYCCDVLSHSVVFDSLLPHGL